MTDGYDMSDCYPDEEDSEDLYDYEVCSNCGEYIFNCSCVNV